MKTFGISILAVILLAGAVLMVMGAKPEDILHIPVDVFNDVILKKVATAKTADTEPDTAPPALKPAVPAPQTEAVVAASVVSAPTPAAPTDLALIAGSPKDWPKVVVLRQKTSFPAVMNGQVVGNVQVPAGMQVKLLALRGSEAQVEYQGASKLIPAESTDVVERVQAARQSVGR